MDPRAMMAARAAVDARARRRFFVGGVVERRNECYDDSKSLIFLSVARKRVRLDATHHYARFFRFSLTRSSNGSLSRGIAPAAARIGPSPPRAAATLAEALSASHGATPIGYVNSVHGTRPPPEWSQRCTSVTRFVRLASASTRVSPRSSSWAPILGTMLSTLRSASSAASGPGQQRESYV